MDAPSIEDLRRNEAVSEGDDYEFVLGRRQLASLGFVVLVLLCLFSGISYLAGRSTAPPKEAAAQDAAANPVPSVAAVPEPVLAASLIAPPQQNPGANDGAASSGLFAEPVAGAIYIQTGAVERGVAAIMAEGLRSHGFHAFVATGPSDKVFRVLMGPFLSLDGYQNAKATLDQIGLNSFAQQYQKK